MGQVFDTELKKAYAKAANKPADLEQFRQVIYTQFNTGSNQLLEVIFAHLQGPKGVHLETALSAAGALAGTLLLRSSGIDLSPSKPGTPVFTDAVNESGPEVLVFMQAFSQQMGIPPFSGWDKPVPNDHKSLEPLMDLVRALEKPFTELSQKLGVFETLRPYMAALGAVKIMKSGEKALNPEISKAIIMSSLVTASKTMPYPVQ